MRKIENILVSDLELERDIKRERVEVSETLGLFCNSVLAYLLVHLGSISILCVLFETYEK